MGLSEGNEFKKGKALKKRIGQRRKDVFKNGNASSQKRGE